VNMSPSSSFHIGSLALPSNVLFAPLAGCSDYPYRHMCRRFHRGLMYCEMVKMEAIIRSDASSFRMLHYDASMHPIGAQLCGSNPRLAASAAAIIEDMGFDVVDLNCGCPVDKVTQDGSGSGLLRTPMVIGDIIANMVASVRIPVTVKIRAGWDEQNIVVRDLVRIAEMAGAQAIVVHGRTRKQCYSGSVNLAWIREAVEQARTIKVIGNGDIFSASAAIRMFQETGCAGVMVARGGIGQPWITEDIRQMCEEGLVQPRSSHCRREALQQHFEATLAYGDDHRAIVDMRRVGCSYLSRVKGSRSFREAFSQASSIDEIRTLIATVPLEEQ
jgi:nifR3 family TIM-barrel protein